MEFDITFDTYIVSNAENEFCQKEKNVLIQRRSLLWSELFEDLPLKSLLFDFLRL